MSFHIDRPLVSPGISGDFTLEAEVRNPKAHPADLARVAYFSELADRFQNGSITDEEEAELIEYFSATVAHDHN